MGPDPKGYCWVTHSTYAEMDDFSVTTPFSASAIRWHEKTPQNVNLSAPECSMLETDSTGRGGRILA